MIIAHIILVNNQFAFNNLSFENNIYTLTLMLCGKLTEYNFFDKYSGVQYPY